MKYSLKGLINSKKTCVNLQHLCSQRGQQTPDTCHVEPITFSASHDVNGLTTFLMKADLQLRTLEAVLILLSWEMSWSYFHASQT